jgi:hypothetical protein
MAGDLSAKTAAFSGHGGVAGIRNDGQSMPFILSKSKTMADETLIQ